MLNVGLIGCGGMGNTHAAAYANLKEKVNIVAVADLLPEKAEHVAKFLGAERIYASGKELLENEKDLDYVDICLPTFLHTEHAVEAMERGMNVFLEKPVCICEEEAQLLLKTQEKTGMAVQIGLCCRFGAAVDYLKNVVQKGVYGKLKTGNFKRYSCFPRWSWEEWYTDSSKCGSMALDFHVHNVDLLLYIMGQPDDVLVSANADKKGDIQHIFATYKYGDAVIMIEDSWDFPPAFPFFEGFTFKFEKATVVSTPGGLTVYTSDGETINPELGEECKDDLDVGINVSSLGEYYSELEYFVNILALGKKPEFATLNDGIDAVRLAWKEIKLFKENRTV